MRWFWLIKSLGKIIQNPAIDVMVLINKKFALGSPKFLTPTPWAAAATRQQQQVWPKLFSFCILFWGYGLLESLAPEISKSEKIVEQKKWKDPLWKGNE